MSMKQVVVGLEVLADDLRWQQKIVGKIGLLTHGAAVNTRFDSALAICYQLFGTRLVKIFGPQHGFVGDVQDNMVETDHYQHPFFGLPVYSLYSHTRRPTAQMLAGLDTILVDLQDVGTRVYTYITTLSYLLEAVSSTGQEVIILDRPNPLGGEIIEGNVLDPQFVSFVGLGPIPMRHGLTLGEMGLFLQKYYFPTVRLKVIPVAHWQRKMLFADLGRVWVNPSPNLPTPESALIYPGSVLFEGTNISEGRGTTRSLETIGHPAIFPDQWVQLLNPLLQRHNIQGVILRPTVFRPTFQKFAHQTCGGVQIHPIDPRCFRPWRLGQLLCHQLYHHLGPLFQWKSEPYEYEDSKLAIDLINGTDQVRQMIEQNRKVEEIFALEVSEQELFMQQRAAILLYE